MIIAKHYVRFQGKMYSPGQEIKETMPDSEWKRLQRLKAIETIHDPVEAVLSDEGDMPNQPPVSEDSHHGEGTEKVEGNTVKVPSNGKAAKGAAAKNAKTDAAKKAKAKEQDIPQIDAAALVVGK